MKALQNELAAIAPMPIGQTQGAPLPDGPVALEHVSFHHSEDDDGGAPRSIDDVSLTIAPHAFVGISGPSGAGKTTLADLLVGLFPPQRGRVTIAGAPLDDALLCAWRERVSYVSQDPLLFHDTVHNNLAWANPQADESAMWQALALVDAARLVRDMESGLDTTVGERGTLVSGGGPGCWCSTRPPAPSMSPASARSSNSCARDAVPGHRHHCAPRREPGTPRPRGAAAGGQGRHRRVRPA